MLTLLDAPKLCMDAGCGAKPMDEPREMMGPELGGLELIRRKLLRALSPKLMVVWRSAAFRQVVRHFGTT